MDPTFGYDELFAYRVMLQDDYENESDIIRELKYILLERGMPQADIPNFLRIFYETYGINISLNTINETLNTEQQMQFNNENEFFNLLTGMLNNQIININTQISNQQQVNQNDLSNNQQVNQNDSSDNQQVNQNDLSNNQQVNVVVNVEDDDDNDLLEEANNVDGDGDLEEDGDGDLEEDDDELPPLEPVTIGNLSSLILTLTANGVQTSLPPIPINPNHTPQQLENILHTLINQQGVSSLSSMFDQQLPHPSIFNNMFNPPMQDVVSTLDEEELKSLKKYKSDKILDENCSICMSKMGDNPEEELCKLPCEHDFHASCIEPYLKEYNYKCPICRKEVGKPKFDI
jgi:hypothetical protein